MRGSSDSSGSWNTSWILPSSAAPQQLSLGEIVAVKADMPAGRLDQADDAAADRRLAGAALADQAERLAVVDR